MKKNNTRKLLILLILLFIVGIPLKTKANVLPSTVSAGEWTVDNCAGILQGVADSYVKYWNGVSQGSANTGGNCSAFQPLALSYFDTEYTTAGSPTPPFEWRLDFYDDVNGTGNYLGTASILYDGVNWTGFTGTVVSQITSFTYSTTTGYARIQGQWNSTTTENITERLQFYQDSTLLGMENFEEVYATTTGNFDFSFFFAGLPYSTSTAQYNFGLYAMLYQETTDPDCNPFMSGDCSDDELLDATSTIIANFEQHNEIVPMELPREAYTFDECRLSYFDMGLCLSDILKAMFIPHEYQITDLANDLYQNVIFKFPYGYLTDFIAITSTTTTGTLTLLDATLPSALGLGGENITLDLTNVLDPYLNATTSQFSGDNPETDTTETLYEVTSYYWDKLVILATLLYILSRIIGSQLIPKLIHKS